MNELELEKETRALLITSQGPLIEGQEEIIWSSSDDEANQDDKKVDTGEEQADLPDSSNEDLNQDLHPNHSLDTLPDSSNLASSIEIVENEQDSKSDFEWD